MKFPLHRCAGRLSLFVTSLTAVGCAGSLPAVEAIDLPRLERQSAASPGDVDLRVQLGMAQFEAGQLDEARETLHSAIEAGSGAGAAYLYLGMVYEELQDWTSARDAYSSYLELGSSAPTRDEVRTRLTLIERNVLRAQARQALAREAAMEQTEPFTPRSVAVLPLAFDAADEELEPLIYALSDLMVADFEVAEGLAVLPRTRIQSLLDEMAIAPGSYADAGTGARVGRLLRAGHVVQGVVTARAGGALEMEADVLDVVRTASAGRVTERAELERVLDMEKQIVLHTIRDILQIELTPAEERAILDNRASSALAFLAHGRGLRALDHGDYAAARAEFERALQLEGGGFEPTELAMAETAALIGADTTGTSALASLAARSGETGVGFFGPPPATTTGDLSSPGIEPAPGASRDGPRIATLRNLAEGVDPTPTAGTLDLGSAVQSRDQATRQANDTVRDPVQEGSNGDSVSSSSGARIRIVIQRPGGTQ